VLPSQLIRILIVVASISVLLIFLAPANFGPFSAVNGPVTARRCKRAADLILLATGLLGLLTGYWSQLFFSASRRLWAPFSNVVLPAEPVSGLVALRC